MAIVLAEFADVKALLTLQGATEDSYPKYQLIAPLVQAAIVDYLGVTLDQADGAETYLVGLEPERLVPLKRLPIATINSVTVDGVATTDYTATQWGVRLGSPVSDATVVVDYDGGYTETPDTVPPALRRAAVYQTAYEMQSSDQIGAVSLSTDGGTVSRPELGLLKETRRSLAPYIHPFFRGAI